MKYLLTAFLVLFSVSSFAKTELTCPMMYELPPSDLPGAYSSSSSFRFYPSEAFFNICKLREVRLVTRKDGQLMAYITANTFVVGTNAQRTYDEVKKAMDLLEKINIHGSCVKYEEGKTHPNATPGIVYKNVCNFIGLSKGVFKNPIGKDDNGKDIFKVEPCVVAPGDASYNCRTDKGKDPSSYERTLAKYPLYIPSEH